MVPQRKIFTVQNLTQKLKDAKALVLTDYRGLSVSQMTDLRSQVQKAGGEVEVVKNRLLGRAAKEARVKIADEALTGPTAVCWAWENEIGPIKALHQFALNTGLPKIKFGIFAGKITPLERIVQLASLPTMEELKRRLVVILQSPTFGLVNALNWNAKKLIYILRNSASQ